MNTSQLRTHYEILTDIEDVHKYVNSPKAPRRFRKLAGMSVGDLFWELGTLSDKEAVQLYTGLAVAGINRRTDLHAPSIISEMRKSQKAEPIKTNVTKRVDKKYLNLFADDAKKDDWNEGEWLIRLEYEQAISDLEKRGLCSSCQRNAILRRCLTKLSDLNPS